MGRDCYLACRQHEIKSYICKYAPTENNLWTDNIALILNDHSMCDLTFYGDNDLNEIELHEGIYFKSIGREG
jgi:hypothetical protein